MERRYLWEDGRIPLFDPAYGDFRPYMDVYPLTEEKSEPCVLVIPGGAYAFVSVKDEGEKVCRYLNANGYAAAMLNYRTAPYAYPAMLLDAQRAIRTLRFFAADWGLDPRRIGSMGFSAGGHLCCLTALCADDGRPDGDEIDALPCRVNTAAPCYAVASLDPAITHMGTHDNFLGPRGDEALAFDFSAENLVGDDTPPVFLWHTAEDGAVPPACSLRFAGALIGKKIPVELHIFPYGGHGSDLAAEIPLANQWPALYIKWLDHYNKT